MEVDFFFRILVYMTLKEKEKRWRQLRKKKLKAKQEWFVYYLPKENYYGHTYDLKTRLKAHKYTGRDISNYTIVKGPISKPEALLFEKLYQGKMEKYKEELQKKKNKECYVYFNGKLIVKTKNYSQAAKYVGISNERVRQLVNTNKTNKDGFSFSVPNYNKWTYVKKIKKSLPGKSLKKG